MVVLLNSLMQDKENPPVQVFPDVLKLFQDPTYLRVGNCTYRLNTEVVKAGLL